MLSKADATAVINKNISGADIQGLIEYQNLYVFKVFTDDPDEGQFDPFYSVDQETGTFAEFPLFLQDNIPAIIDAFETD